MDLTAEQYASLLAEIDVHPARRAEIAARHGIATEAARTEVDRVWAERTSRDPALSERGRALFVSYRDWFQAQSHAQSQAQAQPVPASQQAERRITAPHVQEPAAVPLPFSAEHGAPMAPAAVPTPPDAPDTAAQEQRRRNARGTVAASSFSNDAPLPFKPTEVPDLSVEQYAALMAEVEGYPSRQPEIRALYGIHSEAAFRTCEGHWTGRLAADPTLMQKWARLKADYGRKLVR